MKLKFDPNQQYQLDAVNAVVAVFDGQPLSVVTLRLVLPRHWILVWN